MAEDLNTQPPEDLRPGEGAETLGSILATAREGLGLTVGQMAAELRVESRLLEALEEDRFEALPAPVFVKGYLRHLASRFGLEYDDLLHRYTGQTDTQDAPVTYSEPIPEESRFLAPLLIGALVLVLGIPALWFTWAGRDFFSDIGSRDSEAPVPPPAQTEPVSEEAVALPDPGVAVESAAQPSAVELDPVAPPAGESPPGDVSAPVEQPTETGAADTVATEPVDGPLVRVALSFEEDSWTEVSDGNGNSLYYDLAGAGTAANLAGVPPLSFLLGNPGGVQLSINDQPWPIPPPAPGTTTANFVVDEAP